MEKDFRTTADMRTTKRRWIKLYPIESLNGSIRYQLTSAERGVWYDLLCFSSLCSNTGDICDRDGNPFPLTYIANRLNVQLPLLKGTLDKCLLEGRLTEDEHGLHITNWTRYQSEYDRQKPFRQKAKHNAQWDAMSDEDKAIAIDAFGPVEKWDEINWIVATGRIADEDAKAINDGIIKEGGKPLPF